MFDNFTILRPLDIFTTHGSDPAGLGIRLGETGFNWKQATDPNTDNHVGILYPIGINTIQYFAAEVGDRGIKLNSIEKYRKNSSNRIVRIYRWSGFDNVITRNEAVDYMAYWIRIKEETGYDPIGAIASTDFMHKILPWLKADDNKAYCSEDVTAFLQRCGALFPLEWKDRRPDPLKLRNWFDAHNHEYQLIYTDYRTKL